MNTDPKKKEEERQAVAFLLNQLFSAPVPVPRSHESPDSIVQIGSRTVGIEVTRINVPSDGVAFRQFEGIERTITERAMRIAIDRGLPPAFVSLFFTRNGVPTKKDIERIACGVACAVAERMPSIGASATLNYPFASPSQPIEVDQILVSRYDSETKHEWRETRASQVETDARLAIQDAIDRKHALYAEYRNTCDECWLLIRAEGDKQSSAVRPNEQSLVHRYVSVFDRTFLVNLVYQRHMELVSRRDGVSNIDKGVEVR